MTIPTVSEEGITMERQLTGESLKEILTVVQSMKEKGVEFTPESIHFDVEGEHQAVTKMCVPSGSRIDMFGCVYDSLKARFITPDQMVAFYSDGTVTFR